MLLTEQPAVLCCAVTLSRAVLCRALQITGLEGSGPLVTYENLTLPIVDDAWWQPRRKYFYGPLEGAVSSQFMEVTFCWAAL